MLTLRGREEFSDYAKLARIMMKGLARKSIECLQQVTHDAWHPFIPQVSSFVIQIQYQQTNQVVF